MSSITAKKSPKLADALNPEVLNRSVEQIMQSPAFKRIAKMPDDELRVFAQSDKELMAGYFKDAAKAKHEEKVKQEAQQKAAKENMNRNDPNKGIH